MCFVAKMDSMEGSSKRKTMKLARLDDALYLWLHRTISRCANILANIDGECFRAEWEDQSRRCAIQG